MRLYLHGDCSRGVDLVRAEYVPDDEADIGSTVLRLKERVGPGGFVFTSGGIGATHDDVTYSAIAAAFGAPAAGGSTEAPAPRTLTESTLLRTATQHLHPTIDAGIWRNVFDVLLGWQHTSIHDDPKLLIWEDASAKRAALQAQSCSCMRPRWSVCARITASAASS